MSRADTRYRMSYVAGDTIRGNDHYDYENCSGDDVAPMSVSLERLRKSREHERSYQGTQPMLAPTEDHHGNDRDDQVERESCGVDESEPTTLQPTCEPCEPG